ncbi:hypothetical protein ATO13_05235 [Stappia sp. 22II-S9-Z10]|nr:hypothetical protein ATO13_05235 [Stappia sp. 22II-S9-Z10]
MKPARISLFSRRRSKPQTRAEADMALVEAAFDAEYYLANNPDVAAAGMDPLRHFMGHGWQEGRNPAPYFSVADYLEFNPDVASSGGNPFIHYLRHGRDEGRTARKDADPTAHVPELRALVAERFDARFYAETNKDVVSAGLDPLEHFLAAGWREGRDPRPDFSIAQYMGAHPVVALTGLNPFVHHILFGATQGDLSAPARSGPSIDEQRAIAAAAFHPGTYAKRNPDLSATSDLLEHFLTRGWREGRDPAPDFSLAVYLARHPELIGKGVNPFVHALIARSGTAKRIDLAKMSDPDRRAIIATAFDEAFYRAANRDVAADADAIKHYLRHGWSEGRNPAPWFSPTGYLQENPDVAKAGLEPFSHYLAVGRAEGRRAPRRPALSVESIAEAREAVAEAFDIPFYRGINPDIDDATDPILHYLEHGWTEGRDPAPWFSTRAYLEFNPDVAESGANPFVHYITKGRDERRTVRRPFNRWNATAAKPDGLPAPPAYAPAATLLSAALVTRRIIEMVGAEGALVVTITDVDPADTTGGAAVALEGEAAAASGRPTLNVHPEAPRPSLAGRAEDPVLRLKGADGLIGACKTSAFVEALMAVRYTMLIDVVVHGLAGHQPERLAAALGLSGGRRILWLHDFFLACPCRRLINPDGRPTNPATGQPPHSCRFDDRRAEHQRRIASFLSDTSFTVLAPSLAAKRSAKRLPVGDPQQIRVAAPLTLGAAEPVERSAPEGPIWVAYAADGLDDCGWPLFQEIARRHAFDGRFRFVTFTARRDLPHFITHVPVADAADPAALATAFTAEAVDIVVAAPGWPVPLSVAAHAALAAGTAVIALEASGNGADLAARAAHHLVLPTDEAILEAFAGGAVERMVAEWRAGPLEAHPMTPAPSPAALPQASRSPF